MALSRIRGSLPAIVEIDRLEGHSALDDYHLLPAILAELWLAAGDPARAIGLYRRALAAPCSDSERRFLAARLGTVAGV